MYSILATEWPDVGDIFAWLTKSRHSRTQRDPHRNLRNWLKVAETDGEDCGQVVPAMRSTELGPSGLNHESRTGNATAAAVTGTGLDLGLQPFDQAFERPG